MSVQASLQTPAGYVLVDGYLTCSGDWTLAGLQAGGLANIAVPLPGVQWVDGHAICRLDPSGALMLLDLLDDGDDWPALTGFDPAAVHLLERVCERRNDLQPVAPAPSVGWLSRLGQLSLQRLRQGHDLLAFVGEVALTIGRNLRHPSNIRMRPFWVCVEEAGVRALPILGLLAFLMGVVIAYQGGQQLRTYGANIFIVELVSLTMLRELAPLITAIVVAGRTGSAYAAQIGTMKATEEIDALRTLGIDPLEQLVLPKLFALLLVMPLLTIFADAVAILGGMLVAMLQLDVSPADFFERMPRAVPVRHLAIGLVKAPLFAGVVAVVGCFQGLRVQGGADAVGRQTTRSVVQAIFLVIVVDALAAVVLGTLRL